MKITQWIGIIYCSLHHARGAYGSPGPRYMVPLWLNTYLRCKCEHVWCTNMFWEQLYCVVLICFESSEEVSWLGDNCPHNTGERVYRRTLNTEWDVTQCFPLSSSRCLREKTGPSPIAETTCSWICSKICRIIMDSVSDVKV